MEENKKEFAKPEVTVWYDKTKKGGWYRVFTDPVKGEMIETLKQTATGKIVRNIYARTELDKFSVQS